MKGDSSDSDDHNTTLRLDVITDNVLSEAGYRLTATGPDGAYIGAPHPRNEGKRAKVLQKMEVVDTVAEERFDVMTRICERVFDVPIALVSLIDSNRQWFKSCIGLDVRETPRDMSFCAWTLLPKEPMCLVVPNALEDPRFKGNPLVTGPPNIRFYAGAPLIGLDGARLGALCIIDVRPRILSQRQLEVLSDMGKMCSNELQRQTVKNEHGMEVDKLERDNSLLLTAMEQMEEGVVVVDINADGKVVFCNNGWERLTGISRSFAMGKSLYALLNEERAGAGIMSLCAAMRARENKQVEVEIRRGDGKKLWCQSRANLVKHDAHELYTVTLTDITKLFERNRDLKSANRSLMRLQDVAESASQAKQSFLANMSHEIRTPMNAVIACSGLLQEHADAQEADKSKDWLELVSMINLSGHQLLSLINDVLDFSQIESNGMVLEHHPFYVWEFLDMCIEIVAPKAKEKGLAISYEMDPDVPTHLIGDDSRLRQVLTNLLTNAVKFTEKGSIKILVATYRGPDSKGEAEDLRGGLKRAGNYLGARCKLHVSVTDTGIGIKEDAKQRMFMAFQQVDSSRTRKHGGTGLGLTIVKWLVEKMGGELWVEANPAGLGSIFHFTVEAVDMHKTKMKFPDLPGSAGGSAGGSSAESPPLGRPAGSQDAQEVPTMLLAKEYALPAAGAAVQLAGGVKIHVLLIGMDVDFQKSISCMLLAQGVQVTSASAAADIESQARNLRAVKSKQAPGHTCPFDAVIVDREGLGTESAFVMVRDLMKSCLCSAGKFGPRRLVLFSSELNFQLMSTPRIMCFNKPVMFKGVSRLVTGINEAREQTTEEVNTPDTPSSPHLKAPEDLAILVAEDNLVNQRVMMKLLSSLALVADVVNNGLEAVEACAAKQYDIVLMDLQMPVMDGLEACDRILKACTELKTRPPVILACTADVARGVLADCQSRGMTGYVSKPLTKLKLEDVMKRVALAKGDKWDKTIDFVLPQMDSIENAELRC
mmetsp:Transcript_41097/g.131474  ORF Transcript_41097/g.131474 Transcript_41097/m.131474 type:complete len:992 (-) Transcript_41097:91-3066(-)